MATEPDTSGARKSAPIMMTGKALAQLRGDYTKAKNHLAWLERCVASGATRTGAILLATPDMVAVARANVAELERWLADATPQLPLFEGEPL